EKGGYVLQDPVTGQRATVTAAVAATLSPLAYTFYQPAPPGIIKLRTIGRMLGREVWPDFRRVLWFVGAGAGLGLALPIVTGMMFNDVIPSAAMGNAI